MLRHHTRLAPVCHHEYVVRNQLYIHAHVPFESQLLAELAKPGPRFTVVKMKNESQSKMAERVYMSGHLKPLVLGQIYFCTFTSLPLKLLCGDILPLSILPFPYEHILKRNTVLHWSVFKVICIHYTKINCDAYMHGKKMNAFGMQLFIVC